MKITDSLFRIAGKELNWFGTTRLYPQETELMRSLASVYGSATVEADFVLWSDEVRGQDLDNPVRMYSRLASARLKTVRTAEEQKDDPRIIELSGYVFTLCNRTPHPADIKKFLAKYSLEEIQEAFRAYTAPMDDFEMKFAVKNFFRDNGGEGVIFSLKRQKEAAEKQARVVQESIDAGIAQDLRDQQQRVAEAEEEDRRAERLGDQPF